MTTVGQIEKQTQARVVALFRERLCYDYLGDKTDLNNHNLELTVRSNSSKSSGLKSRPGSCPFAPVA